MHGCGTRASDVEVHTVPGVGWVGVMANGNFTVLYDYMTGNIYSKVLGNLHCCWETVSHG